MSLICIVVFKYHSYPVVKTLCKSAAQIPKVKTCPSRSNHRPLGYEPSELPLFYIAEMQKPPTGDGFVTVSTHGGSAGERWRPGTPSPTSRLDHRANKKAPTISDQGFKFKANASINFVPYRTHRSGAFLRVMARRYFAPAL